MKAKFKEKEEAIRLRLAGESYSRIKKIIGVSKGTLSLWLGNMPLSQDRIKELRDWNEVRIERYRETRRKKRDAIIAQVYKSERKKILPLSPRDIFIAGLFLYWGEGGKTKTAEISLSNTNPEIIKTFIYWLENAFAVDRKKLKIRLHLYKDMDAKKEINFWSKSLAISISQFRKPYIKDSNRSSITYKNGFGHGTCNVNLGSANIARKVLIGLQVLKDYFSGPVA